MPCKHETIIPNALNVSLFYRSKKCLLPIDDGKTLEAAVWSMEPFLTFFDTFVRRI